MLPPLLRRLPQQPALRLEASSCIHFALLHPDHTDVVQDGAEALCRWAYAAAQNLAPALPDSLVAEFVLRLGMPTRPGLLEVLAWATSLLANAPRLPRPAHAPALGEALTLLLAETEPPTWRERNLARQTTAQERLFQRPRVRVLAARLAGQLSWLQTQQPATAPSLVEALTDWPAAIGRDHSREVNRAWQAGQADTRLHDSWQLGQVE